MRLISLVLVLAAVGCSNDDDGTRRAEGTPCDVDGDCAGAFPELRDCEAAVCGAEGVCIIGAQPDGTECRDGLACTNPDYCLQGQCTGASVRCVDNDPCTRDTCDNKTGCLFLPASDVACDDDNACTVGDTCVDGACQSGELQDGCCRFDGDCGDDDPCTDDRCRDNACQHPFNFAPCDDGNVCTGPDHCDGAGTCGGAELACEDGNPCTLDACNPETGQCQSNAADDGIPCEDGNPCTVEDACLAGACVSGESLCECTTDADCAPQEDEDLCNGTLVCANLRCVINPLTIVECNPTGDTTCVKNSCDPLTGQCRPLPSTNGLFCDDQNPCTGVDQCQNGLCLGIALDCDDDNPCTFDACSPVSGCVHNDNNLSCSDGSVCTVNDQCQAGACVGVPTGCDDDNPCTDDACDDVTGCKHTPNTASCDDGDPCTPADVCSSGQCQGGGSSICKPCDVDVDCAPFDDGNQCNGTLVCRNNACIADPATVVVCDTSGDTSCSRTRCVTTTGLCVAQPVADGSACSDGTSCTLQDRCQSGLCVGQAVGCDDGNPCTNDACDPQLGCRNVPHASSCDDGNACTTGDICTGGLCAGVLRVCDDGNECTVDSCDTLQGCRTTNAPDTTVCDDDSVCTTNDRCRGGTCTGTALVCADTNPCTQDLCNPVSGCAFPAIADGGACSDGDVCTTNDVCAGGTCAGQAVDCDDDNDCTLDVCDPATGCESSELPDDEPCQDGNVCTAPDTCQGGVCVAGVQICTGCLVDGCPDPGQCKTSVCNEQTGACVTSNVAGSCNDGSACTSGDTCSNGTCTGTAVTCNDAKPCTDDTCDPASGCVYTNDDTNNCSDGNVCNGAETCRGGTCVDGPDLVCNDNNPCTNDSCNTTSGCVFTNNNAPCPDANLCDGAEVCSGGSCPATGANPVNCNDNNTCTTDSCTPATGVCSNVAIPGCGPAVSCNGPFTVDPDNQGRYASVPLSGTVTSSGSGGLTYSWVVTQSPDGASNAQPLGPTSLSTSITPDIAGSYVVRLTITDSAGATASCSVSITARVIEVLRVELVWDEPWGDADLHLAHPAASLPADWFTRTTDRVCWWGNGCASQNGLPWGGTGNKPGNPTLDRDDANGYGPENINIQTGPVISGTYTIAVEYFCQHSLALRGNNAESPIDGGDGPSNGTVRIHCGGNVTAIPIDLDQTGRFIVVGTVTMPGCAVNTALMNESFVGDIQIGPAGCGTVTGEIPLNCQPLRCDIQPCGNDNDCLSGEFCREEVVGGGACLLENP